MLPLLTAILIASLLGSTHCAGMCGAFALFASSPGGRSGVAAPSPLLLSAAYNLARLLVYIVLGVVAGTIGAALDLSGSMIGIQRAAAIGSGLFMVGFGTAALLRARGVRLAPLPIPEPLLRAARAGHCRALKLAPLARAAAVGLLTTLLPCGWLYAFVLASAGTASPVWGAASMGAFWLGTLPVLAAIGIGAQRLCGPLRQHLPLATSLLLVAAGMATLLGRLAMPAVAATSAPTSVEQALDSVDHAAELCPLCGEKGE